MRAAITERTAERLSRAAYEYEHLAARFRQAGFPMYANSLHDISSQLGKMGRSLAEQVRVSNE